MTGRRALTGCLAAAAMLVSGCGDTGDGPQAVAPAKPTRPRPGPVRLETGVRGEVSWTARVVRVAPGRSAPSAGAPVWIEVTPHTPFTGRPARLRVTGAYRDTAGRQWVRVQLALRPNGTAAWVPRSAVRLSATRLRIRVDLSARRLDLFRDGRRVASWPAGVGRPEYPTPTGTFAIEDVVPTSPRWRTAYGRHVLTLTAFSNVLTSFMGGEGQSAIHGSGTLGKVGRASSFGCVVLGDAALQELYRTVRPGTPVDIVA